MGDQKYGRVLDAERPYLIHPNETTRALPEMFLDRKQLVIYHQLTYRLWESDQDLLQFELGEGHV
jgi:predicted dithiol-disulfide oxidoreductase (DUF899 family)